MSSGGDEPESGEAVANVESSYRDLRPSEFVSASSPVLASTCPAQSHVQGQGSVSIRVRTAPTLPLAGWVNATDKINNYIGTTSAASTGENQTASVTRTLTVQVDQAKGGDARGIPPRGRPV